MNTNKCKEFNLDEIIRTIGFWNNDRIIKSIKQLMDVNKKFPTQKEMSKISGLVVAVQKHGGINYFKKIINP